VPLNIAVGEFVYLKKSSVNNIGSVGRRLAKGGTVTSINDKGVAIVVTPDRASKEEVHVTHFCKPTDLDALEPYID
jgi:hypothetical protein